MEILIKNIRVVNPKTDFDEVSDLFIYEGKVKKIAPAGTLDEEFSGPFARTIDGTGLTAFPGIVDLHVHLRDPGQTEKEDLNSGSLAAAAGGVTTLVAMPNTHPPIDSLEKFEKVTQRAEEVGLVNILQAGSITKGMQGAELSDMFRMMDAGCRAFSEDGKSVMDTSLMRDAMRETAESGVPILAHCEDANLARGVMNAGQRSRELGLPGITNAVENIIEFRDIELSRETGAALHLCHCSTKESYEIVKNAKAKGINVTAEVCPHHFTLIDADIPDANDANYKMNPPLRSKLDRDALIKGLADGTFDCIATDHAPHTKDDKAKGFLRAPFGIVGLETSFSLSYTELVKKGVLTFKELVEKLSVNPAKILKIDRGDISEGKTADIAIADLSEEYRIDTSQFKGKSNNCPYNGLSVTGRIKMTICSGKVVYEA